MGIIVHSVDILHNKDSVKKRLETGRKRKKLSEYYFIIDGQAQSC